MSKAVADRIKVYPEGDLPCPVAHYIAAELGVDPLEVGQTANEIDVRITMCQLGLFGYAVKGKPAYRILSPMEDMPQELAEAIRKALVDGRAPCAALWQIAQEFDLSRHEVGNASEALQIKVKPCQLGCF
jgi:hypothetical protein